jgi:Xaa-Pro aminopeptidase
MSQPVERLALLRAAMRQNSIDAYIIPLSDPHISEYVPDHWKIITWLTGFTGSAATVVITDSFAGLWTDSRYFIQAENEISGSGFMVVKPSVNGDHSYIKWLSENLSESCRIALDGKIFPARKARELREALSHGKRSFDFTCDLVSDLWTDRPPMPASKVEDHPLAYCGKERSVKIDEVRKLMAARKADYSLLTSPDDIMWLLNIRGRDLQFTPLVFSFAVVGKKQIFLFADEGRFPVALASELDRIGVLILPYEETTGMISVLKQGKTILVSPQTTSVEIYDAIPSRFRIIEDTSIPSALKAVKNRTELENIGKVMIKDGVVLTKFFHWIEDNAGLVPMTERSLSMRLHEFKLMDREYRGPSFQTIVAYNHHAALPHYTARPESDMELGEEGILLVDSGSQYPGGTTDITRTIPVGIPTKKQKRDFTLVLKGHIRLANAKFPAGTKGYQLDILAREALWNEGLNYGHGTGHGVGYFLSVHEGPQGISPAVNKTPIEEGMIVSNEPALYREGEYGIRTENLLVCYEDEESEFGKFLRFDTLSLCYIEQSLIDKELMNKRETDWLNSYHSEVCDKLSPHLSAEEREWLREKTRPL